MGGPDVSADELTSDTYLLLTVGAATLNHAEALIESCERCRPQDAEIPFDWILDDVTGRSGSNMDYFLLELPRCPNCRRRLTEKTLVEPK
jgi:hypothetical protein